MPSPQHKLVKVPGLGIVKFPEDIPDEKVAAVIRSYADPKAPHESAKAYIPPEVRRVEDQVGVKFRISPPYKSEYGPAISSVVKHEPHIIDINNPKEFATGPKQTIAHEVIHLWQHQLAGPIQKAMPPNDPKNPYDLSNIDAMRAKGLKLWNLPPELAASLVQRYVAIPSSRKQLKVWVDDLADAPLSLVNPTSPSDKTINITPRAPVPPVESYQYLEDLKNQAQKMKPKVVK